MALVPHKITALAESDAQGTDGKNIVAGAVVSLYDTNGTAVTLFDDESGTNGSTAKQTDATGQVVVYVTAGEYDEEVNGSIKRKVTIGGSSPIEAPTFSGLENLRPFKVGQAFICQERANAKYILQASGYTALPGDVTFANGRVGALQDIFSVKKYGAKGDGETDDTAAIQDCFTRVHAEDVYDQQFYGGVVQFGTGSYLITSTLQWRRFSIEGQGSFQTTLLWGGGSGSGMLNKEQANTWMKGCRLTVVNGGLNTSDFPDYYIDSDVTKVDWAWHMYDVYFGKAGVVAIRTGQPVNFYFNRVRWDNSACLLEVNGEGAGSNNRIISLKDCTVDFTQLTGANVHVDCLFRFNLGNSDYYSFILENWRFEGENAEFSGGSLIQVNDLNSPSQELRSRPLQVIFKNVGISIDNSDITKRLDLVEVNTNNGGFINVPISFENFYQNGNITELFTPSSIASLNPLQSNPQIPLTMGLWVLWPTVGGAGDEPLRMSGVINYNDVNLFSENGSFYAKSVLMGEPGAESDIKAISNGSIDVLGKSGLVTIDTEGGAAIDDLSNIQSGVGNQRIILRTVSNARDVVVKDGVGNMQLDKSGGDITLGSRGVTLELIYSEQIGAWLEL